MKCWICLLIKCHMLLYFSVSVILFWSQAYQIHFKAILCFEMLDFGQNCKMYKCSSRIFNTTCSFPLETTLLMQLLRRKYKRY